MSALLLALPSSMVGQGPTRPTPLRFGVEFARATPTGAFGRATNHAEGFLGWLALPLSPTSPFSVNAEFSVLTVPVRQVAVPLHGATNSMTVNLSSTLTFVGVGVRAEQRLGVGALAASLMPGYARVITDLTGQVGGGTRVVSVASSSSEYAFALKGGVAATLPLYRGLRGTALGLAFGADYTVAGKAPFPEQDSFGFDSTAVRLTLSKPEVALSHWRLHAGLGVEF